MRCLRMTQPLRQVAETASALRPTIGLEYEQFVLTYRLRALNNLNQPQDST